jgi:hypothetical protein
MQRAVRKAMPVACLFSVLLDPPQKRIAAKRLVAQRTENVRIG